MVSEKFIWVDQLVVDQWNLDTDGAISLRLILRDLKAGKRQMEIICFGGQDSLWVPEPQKLVKHIVYLIWALD